MKTKNKEILEEIKLRLNLVQRKETINGRKNWTKAFFDILKEIGIEEGHKVYSSSTSTPIPEKDGGPEWLFDLSWSIESRLEDSWMTDYKGLKLICESEWNMSRDEVIYDFQKLLVGKADIKIMIVQFNKKETFDKVMEWCKQAADISLRGDDSAYILIGSGKDDMEVRWEPLW